MDGIDAVLAWFSDTKPARVVAHASIAMPTPLRNTFMALNQPGGNELAVAASAGNDLARLYAKGVSQVLASGGLDASKVRAIGAHGQTVRHHPEQGYTIQINAPALLAELCGIHVIADFRSRDIAAGGQGAPLAPIAHQALFASVPQPCAILNLGGMGNVTILKAGQPLTGFDTGPGNVLLDSWAQACLGQPFDREGAWAASGRVNSALLDALLASEPWFSLPPPKSTGRHLFNESWLRQRLSEFRETTTTNGASSLANQDIQATLVALTAHTAARAIGQYAPDTQNIVVCGGGALNPVLLDALRRQAPAACKVSTSQNWGIAPQQVEALAFAWLARAWEHGMAAGVPSVTGARAARILGCCYPA